MTFDPASFDIAFFVSLAAIANGVFIGLLPYIAVFLAISLFVLMRSQAYRAQYGLIVAFGFIGTFLGICAGASKEPTVVVMLPVVVILIGGFAAYLFVKKSGTSPLFEVNALPIMLCALVVAASFGSVYSATIRTLSLRTEFELDAVRQRSNLESPEIETRLNGVKRCLQMFTISPDVQKNCADLLKSN